MRLVIAGGGTGGHLFPALAVAQATRREDPDGSILFVGTRNGIEARIVPETVFPIRFISARGLRRTGLVNTLRGALEIPRGIIQSLSILRAFKPGLVLGVGGYASGPTLTAAILMRIPTAIQEQNSVMGTTNRLLCRFVNRIFVSWERTEPAPPMSKTLHAGNPIRNDLISNKTRPRGDAKFHVLIFGGSQGARSINRSIADNLAGLERLADRVAFIHQTGRESAEELRDLYAQRGIEADVREFIHEMGEAYHWADLVVCRAGASSLAELTALGKPAVVVPYPYAIGDHQAKNAAVLESRGAVQVIREENLKNGAIIEAISRLVGHPEELEGMAAKSRALGKPDAARTIALDLLSLARSGPERNHA
jgi:UDP-N-acetylglucosamine--N-acetylmuramyl-(pentapeptide) pyrophosphoryl-undecaprenol N-acetylglucosamine transferase